MNVPPPARCIFIDQPPTSNAFDLTERIQIGIRKAQDSGIDICYIVESDDFYPANYFQLMDIGSNDFIGCDKSLYYNLHNSTYQTFSHPGRASLYNTGFRISSLKDFQWPANDHLFLDLMLWKYAVKKLNYRLLDHPVGVGIKGHLQGKTGGAGHRMTMKHKDVDFKYLSTVVDPDSLLFYKSL